MIGALCGGVLLLHGRDFQVGANQGREGEEGVGRGVFSYNKVGEGFGDSRMLLPREWDNRGGDGERPPPYMSTLT